MYHRIGNSALETTGISAESYELAKDAAVTAASVMTAGKMLKATKGIGKKLMSSSLNKSFSNTPNKSDNSSDNNQQSESTHSSNSLNSISDVNQAIEQTRSSKDNYTKKLEKTNSSP